MKVNGIALVQVLILTALLSIFALYISSSAKDQVQLATWSNERAEAELLIRSTYSELLFALLTNERAKTSIDEGGTKITERWNFFGHPFSVTSQIEVRLQDLSGKIGLHFFERNRLESLLRYGGVSEDRIGLIIDRLLDWQDADNIARPQGGEGINGVEVRDGYVTDLTDLEKLIDLTPAEKALLYENTTIYFNGSFNPLTASKSLLAAETDETSAEQIDALRKERDVTPLEYRKITGKGVDTDVRLYPGPSVEFTITAKVGDARITKHFVVGTKRYSKGKLEPINIMYKEG
ncbi:hypothetical protein CBQ28_03675 [Pseudoalteromonas sp. GCY]|nr:type II secretion system protein GspK [Pseudoalteromonas sp. GCY]PHI38628.1 hypothetical protein CBQ28_03675 [Pseudoalteromonas sp. GCY]